MKTCIVLKNRVYCAAHNDYSRMLDELNIEDTEFNARTKFVVVELCPPHSNKYNKLIRPNPSIFISVDNWQMEVKQQDRPTWFIEETARPRVVAAVKEWTKTHVFENKNNFRVVTNDKVYIKNCSDVHLYGFTHAEVFEGCNVFAHDYTSVSLYYDSSVQADGRAIINSFNNCEVTARDNCYVNARGQTKLKVYDEARFVLHDNSVVYLFHEGEDDNFTDMESEKDD